MRIFNEISVLSSQKPFDAEELSECKLLIGARGSDGEEQTQVIVKIADENDNAPLFSQAFYTGHVTEGSPKNSPVRGGDGKPLVIHATDADVSSSDLLYEVIGSSAFLIDPHSGALKTKEVKFIIFYYFKVYFDRMSARHFPAIFCRKPLFKQ